jgi:signal transduction histidine kinase
MQVTSCARGGVGRARIEIDHASALIDRLLELARLDASTLHLERISPAEVVERVMRTCAALAAEREVSIVRQGEGDIVVADAVLLERLLTNLVSNAIRFADTGSTVTVLLGGCRMEVHDVGVLIPGEELNRIFEPFYQSDSSRAADGSGLGLAIASAIAEAHGWTLSAASAEKSGTTFVIQAAPPRSR